MSSLKEIRRAKNKSILNFGIQVSLYIDSAQKIQMKTEVCSGSHEILCIGSVFLSKIFSHQTILLHAAACLAHGCRKVQRQGEGMKKEGSLTFKKTFRCRSWNQIQQRNIDTQNTCQQMAVELIGKMCFPSIYSNWPTRRTTT